MFLFSLIVLVHLVTTSLALLDRRSIVARYPQRPNNSPLADATFLDPADVFTLGNGDFAFNVDATGLQTFNASFANTGPRLDLNTLSSWAFHSIPAVNDGSILGARRALSNFNFTVRPTATSFNTSRLIPLADGSNSSDGNSGGWMMSNPHRLGLGQIALRISYPGMNSDPITPSPQMLTNISSELNTWTGSFSSSFILHLPEALSPFCGTTDESTSLQLVCSEPGAIISKIINATYGTPISTCPSPIINPSCNALNSTQVIEELCLGKSSCVIPTGNNFWGDPCIGKVKQLVVAANCSQGGGYSPSSSTAGNVTFSINVDTVVHPDVDLVSTRFSCSNIIGRIACPTNLRLALPYATGNWGPSPNEWDPIYSQNHTTSIIRNESTRMTLLRTIDDTSVIIDCVWNSSSWIFKNVNVHAFALFPPMDALSASVEFSCLFAPPNAVYPLSINTSSYLAAKQMSTLSLLNSITNIPLFTEVQQAAATMWLNYWQSGAFVDLAHKGVDPNAIELERRVILSKYLVRAHSAGMTPPQETGLLSNSWSGKFHLEMRWWHLAHYPLWFIPDLLDRSHAFYFELLPNATSLAKQQGYKGARWLKMLGLANRINSSISIDVPWLGESNGWSPPPGDDDNGLLLLWESANEINPVLTWNQPPVIWLADAERRAINATRGSAAALEFVQRLAPIVFATADFCSTLPFFNETSGFYEIGSPTLGAEEFGHYWLINKPVFETVYFSVALDMANEWREYLGMERDALYDAVASGLGGLPLDPAESVPTYSFNGNAACCYVTSAECPSSRFGGLDQCDYQAGHPSPSAITGLLNGRRFGDRYHVDAKTSNNTVAAIVNRWQWSDGSSWGWDNPLAAMGECRNGWKAESMVEMLLMPSIHNTYWRTGYNWQGSFVYLPGNGGTLSAVAMMAAGTDTSPTCNFPISWNAICEGFLMSFP
jgi:protein-glucosylgalactosylhydroxylysine glucosidase